MGATMCYFRDLSASRTISWCMVLHSVVLACRVGLALRIATPPSSSFYAGVEMSVLLRSFTTFSIIY
jgi:hypothetical protein